MWRFWFLLCMSLREEGGEGAGEEGGLRSRTVGGALTVSQGNYTPATVVCQDALRSNHLIADVADDKTEILQCGEVAAVEHVVFAELHGFTEAVTLFAAVIQGCLCVVYKA